MKWPDVRTILALTVAAGIVLFGVIGVIATLQGRTLGDESVTVTVELLAVIVGGLIGAAALSSGGKNGDDE